MVWSLGGSACGEPEVEVAPEPEVPVAFFSEVLETDLQAVAQRVEARGFREVEAAAWRGFLVDRTTEVEELEMRANACHVFVAAGSEAIEAFEMRVFDSEGREVALNVGHALRFCPAQSGLYFLGLRAQGSGLFSLRRFRGPTGLDLRLDDLNAQDAP